MPSLSVGPGGSPAGTASTAPLPPPLPSSSSSSEPLPASPPPTNGGLSRLSKKSAGRLQNEQEEVCILSHDQCSHQNYAIGGYPPTKLANYITMTSSLIYSKYHHNFCDTTKTIITLISPSLCNIQSVKI